jgi:hypothetical protein
MFSASAQNPLSAQQNRIICALKEAFGHVHELPILDLACTTFDSGFGARCSLQAARIAENQVSSKSEYGEGAQIGGRYFWQRGHAGDPPGCVAGDGGSARQMNRVRYTLNN